MKIKTDKLKILFIFSITIFLTSCIGKKPDISGKKRIVTTIFPIYDWTRNLMDDGNNNNLLLSVVIKSAVDFHSYQASDADISQISNADLFIYAGGESDKWVEEVLANTANKNMVVINLMDVLKENLNNQQIDDEHIWLSPVNAIYCCQAITEKLCQIDNENSETYKNSGAKYTEKLTQLDDAYKDAVENAKNTTLIFCDKFPFKPLLNQYGLKYYSAFEKCPAESGEKTETIEFLAEKVDELKAAAVYVTESSDKKLAREVISASKSPMCDTVVLDSMQTTTLNQAFYGKTYLKTMQENLAALGLN